MDLEGLVSAFQNDSLGVEDGVAIAEKIKNGALDRRTVTLCGNFYKTMKNRFFISLYILHTNLQQQR
tara:strand:+ start:186 stop:386 length:201 start_codon:yes stop_codon:yes gene_type:complete